MSQTQKVFDASGVWFTNTGQFSFIDWTNGCRFDPGVRTQAPETVFTKSVEAVLKVEKPEPKIVKK
jgi:hypothetical protein